MQNTIQNESTEEELWDCIKNTTHNILLHAPGGCGKSYMVQQLKKRCSSEGMQMAITATTGIAAYQISGYTIHSWSGIGIPHEHFGKNLDKVKHRRDCVQNIKTVDILVIDEISMFGKKMVDLLDYIFKKIRRNDRPFGGIRVLFTGDFMQLSPVKDEWAFKSEVWEQLKFAVFKLFEPKRYTDIEYFDTLLRIRKGEQTKSDIERLYSRVKAYENLSDDDEMEVKPTILFSKKMDVRSFNDANLKNLSTKEVVFTATDIFEPSKRNTRLSIKDYEVRLEYAAPKSITLKIGAQVMLKRNLDIDLGLVNGSRGVVVDVNDYSATVKFVNGAVHQIIPKSWSIEDDNGIATRTQIPFILAWALTIHSCQGCTLDLAICDCGWSVFCSGQTYVALSRVRSFEGLYLMEFTPDSIIVDQEALEYTNSLSMYENDYYKNETFENVSEKTLAQEHVNIVVDVIPNSLLEKTLKEFY